VVRYGKHLQLDGLGDDLILSLMTWMKKRGVERGWKVTNLDCPACSSRATSFVNSKDLSFTVCQHCASAPERPAMVEHKPLEDHIKL